MKTLVNIICILILSNIVLADGGTNPPHCTMLVDVVVSRTGCDTLQNQVVVTPSGGVAPYEYSLNGINWVTDSIFDGSNNHLPNWRFNRFNDGRRIKFYN